MNTSKRLSPGRHKLTRDEIAAHQRDRILEALEAVMGDKGYPDTSVADIIKRARVSRLTFYELFDSKQNCFLAGYSRRQVTMLGEMATSTDPQLPPFERFAAQLRTYLDVLAANPKVSRLYLVGAYMAGPDVMRRRIELQKQFVEGVVAVLELTSESERFACTAFVAATSAMVTNTLIEGDGDAVLGLYDPLLRLAEHLLS